MMMRRGMSRAVLLLALMGGMPLVMEGPPGPEPEPEPEPGPEPEPELLRARLAQRPIPIVAGPYLEGGPPAPLDGVAGLGAPPVGGRGAGSRARRRWKNRRRTGR